MTNQMTHPAPSPPRRYAQYVDLLDACSRDNLEFVKDKAVKTIYELLR